MALPTPAAVVLYRGPLLQPLRLLLRMKVAQLGTAAGAAIPIGLLASGESLSLLETGGLAALVAGSGAASAALYYYGRRYVGELALVGDSVRISSFDFWGHRLDMVVPRADVVPPLEGLSAAEFAVAASAPLLPLPVIGHRQFALSLRYGTILKKEELKALLCSRP